MADSPKVAELRTLLEAFEKARDDHSDVGAGDTEPREIGYDHIYRAAEGVRFPLSEIPTDPDGWQLYTPDEEDPDPKLTPEACAAAAAELNRTCTACVEFLWGFTEANTVQRFAMDWCS